MSRLRVVSLLVAMPAAAVGCKRDGGAQGPPGVSDTTEYIATLKSRASAALRPEVDGRVTEILVRPGDRVSAGTPLVQIDPAKQEATLTSQEEALAAKRASLEYARQQYDRVRGLAATGISSQADLDQAKAAFDAAKAELATLEAQVRE